MLRLVSPASLLLNWLADEAGGAGAGGGAIRLVVVRKFNRFAPKVKAKQRPQQ